MPPLADYRPQVRIVPAVVGWRSSRHAWLNYSLFGLAVLLGTWLVHQTEYALEFGSRFSAVMAANPHRAYMAPAGMALILAFIVCFALGATFLGLTRVRLRRLHRRLPSRLARRLAPGASTVPWSRIGATALLLALMQGAAYLLQENLETLAVAGTLPGASVLLAPQHATVIPLHLAAAVGSSLILWTASIWLGRVRRALGMARVLLTIATRRHSVPPHRSVPRRYLPNLRVPAGARGLRSPPLSA